MDQTKIVTAAQEWGHKRAWSEKAEKRKIWGSGDLQASLKIGKQAAESVLERLLNR